MRFDFLKHKPKREREAAEDAPLLRASFRGNICSSQLTFIQFIVFKCGRSVIVYLDSKRQSTPAPCLAISPRFLWNLHPISMNISVEIPLQMRRFSNTQGFHRFSHSQTLYFHRQRTPKVRRNFLRTFRTSVRPWFRGDPMQRLSVCAPLILESGKSEKPNMNLLNSILPLFYHALGTFLTLFRLFMSTWGAMI